MNFAYLYPGQGSQSLGMMTDLASSYPEVKHIFEQASEILKQNLWNIIEEGPEKELNRTENTQPIMLCASLAINNLWVRQFSGKPLMLAGHSFGEYTALVVAGCMSFESTIPLAKFRGQVMQEAVPEGQGAMAAILGLDDEKLLQACEESAQGEVVEMVNFNAPGQTVIAGDKAAVIRAVETAKSTGARRAVILPMSVPSHSSLMKPAAERLRDYLNALTFSELSTSVIQNVDVKAYSCEIDIKDALYRQLFNPVRWVETIDDMVNEGVTAFVELGPGKVLMGLCKRINRKIPCYSVHDSKSLEETLEIMTSLNSEVKDYNG